jgi:hypothetical protein
MALETLSNIKAWLSITGNDQDAILTQIQDAVDQAITNYCDTEFTETTVTGELIDCRRSDILVPQFYPIISVQELLMGLGLDGSGGVALEETDYILRPDGIYLKTQIMPQGRGLAKISYHYGYATVPARVKMASTLAVEAFYRRRSRKSLGLSSRSKEGESQSYENYSGAWDKLTGLPTDVVSMLGEYRDISIPVSPMSIRNR